ncbi:MAG TPA: adenylate/guanylate cyclase domain-containing protein [Candidatus Ozemobacteraceae bacterium]|nr:adenylate/guanylate cyclase domain-containing protein [Candidatus Ozemobacteraceae bacterium]
MESRLLTIVFVDMQGYTRRSAGQTIEEMKLFHDQMYTFVSEIMQKWNGVMVKSLGDGFMVRFDSPTSAVQAGIEIQRRLDARNAQMMNPDSIVRFRIGINTGEVGIDENGDLFGDPVNIASRIQTFADPSDVFISESTYLAMNRNEFGAVDLGAQELKNATREIKIYKILKNGAPGLTLPGNRQARTPDKAAEGTPPASGNHLKLIAAGVLLGIFLMAAAGVVLKRMRRSDNQPDVKHIGQKHAEMTANPVNPENPPPPVSEQHGRPPRENMPPGLMRPQTLLEIDPGFPKLPLNEAGRKALIEIQSLNKTGRPDEALRVARSMLEDAGQDKKIVWALLIGELLWTNGQKQKAQELFADIQSRSGNMPEPAKKQLHNQIELIKSR